MKGYIIITQCIEPPIHQIIALSTIIKSVGIYIMTIQEAKHIRIADYLQSLGYTPIKRQGNSLWYKSPMREEAEASFKVNTELNQWYDFGIGKGGNIIALASELYRSDNRQTDTASAHCQPYTVLFWSAIRFRTDVPTLASYGAILSCAAVLFAGASNKHRTRQEGM